MRNPILWILTVLMGASGASSEAAGRRPQEIKQLVRQCVDEQKRSPGMVIGIIDARGTNIYAHGICERGKTNEVNGDTLFEIGSITKVFTTTLLQLMVDGGEVRLEDPISKYLPKWVKTPKEGNREITLLDLAMHTSGLPSMPDNLVPKDGDDPWANYTVEQMYEYLGKCKLRHRLGSKVDYSNYGMGLLGHILALRAGTNYESLVMARICEPLGMNSTRIILSDEMKRRLATGHSVVGPPVKNWSSLALLGDGALCSSVNDMLKFLAANLGRGPGPLSAAMAKTHSQRKKVVMFMKIGLGWMHLGGLGMDLIWHDGGTGGYCSFIGFDKSQGCGVVVLANEANEVDDVGRRIVLPEVYDELDKFKAPKQRTAAKIDAGVYNRYVGEYRFNRRESISIRQDGDHLVAKVSGPMEFSYTVVPESETAFFYTALDAQIHFITNGAGEVRELIFFQDGKREKAMKVK